MYQKFEKLLHEKGVSVTEVAKATGIHQTTFSHWKSDDYTPKVDKIMKICEYFGVPISYFYEE